MNDHAHPSLEQEQQRLELTLEAIDDHVRMLRQLGWSGSAVPQAAFQARTWAWKKSDRLLESRSSPYFGRIDVSGEGEGVESYYIGPEGLPHPAGRERLIVDWRAPISAAFYRPDDQTLLKRRIQIDDARLVRIVDEYARAVDTPGAASESQADPMLHDILAQARGDALGSIVRTIQAQQDELIRASDTMLVVQGAAGTGKTVVALHRLAFLLYQSRATRSDDDSPLQAEYPAKGRQIVERTAGQAKVAIFGPNNAYLRHVRAVLPALGEPAAVGTTFEEWVRVSWPDGQLELAPTDDDLDQILDASLPREQRERRFRRARVKGSLEMGQMLTRYVSSTLSNQLASLRHQSIQFNADVEARPTVFRVALPDVGAWSRLGDGTPLNRIREVVRERMRQRVRDQVDQRIGACGISADRQGHTREYTAAVQRFDAAFERRWPRWGPTALFRALLGDAERLREASAEVQIDWQWLHDASPRLLSEDVAPLAFLRMLVDGPIPTRPPNEAEAAWTRLDHAVIDEAQDLAPLALTVLRAHADSLTVLGDMNQAIYAHRGSRSWSEVMLGLGRDVSELRSLSVSYRSTQEISDLANHVVKVGGLHGGESQPFPRVGARPLLRQAEDRKQLESQMVDFVNEAARDGCSTVAVLTRTAADARALFNAIKVGLEAPAICILDRRDARDAPTVVMPAYLAKGIEFDAVAVVDVDAASYTNTVNDATLLYVAIKRALHRLMLSWCGAPSPLIADRI